MYLLKYFVTKLEENKDEYERSTFLQIIAEIIVPNLNLLSYNTNSNQNLQGHNSFIEAKEIISTIWWWIETILKSNFWKVNKVDINSALSTLTDLIPTLIQCKVSN